ncbi:MAG TPA: hypothetical protein PKW06_11345 [Cyclobacteriaceae bacterium]|nr:hypothetical protein [Cyclobacteriaceae bacterium]MCO5270920.1 hypothetical protein [Cyclobacteriaceae bacterium]MCW5901794.1 hypothetical protein [Cyclobacteriaceae bacterium]HOO10523.1 hypothetical protein [Cyclobacteriaceae bacterium]HPI80720.1 hypothetical protein [Cyclobacteriaceae bacterium]
MVKGTTEAIPLMVALPKGGPLHAYAPALQCAMTHASLPKSKILVSKWDGFDSLALFLFSQAYQKNPDF